MSERNMIRWGIFRQSDIDDNGEIKKGAPIVGYYAPNYDRPDNPITFEGSNEHWGQEHNYDGMYHEGRHFDVDRTDAEDYNTPLFRNLRVKNRGTSALDYVKGREKEGDYWGRTERHGLVSDEEERRDRLNYSNPNGVYERFSTHLISPENYKVPDSDEEELVELAKKMGFFHNRNVDIGDVKGKDTITLPFVVSVDPSKIVNFEDVESRGFDPQRDYLNERQFQGYNIQRLPSGLFTATTIGNNPTLTNKTFMGTVNIFGNMYGKLIESVAENKTLPEKEFTSAGLTIGYARSIVRTLDKAFADGYSNDIMKMRLADAKEGLSKAVDALDEIKQNKPKPVIFNYGDDEGTETIMPREVEDFYENCDKFLRSVKSIIAQAEYNEPRAGERIITPTYENMGKQGMIDFLKREFDPKKPTNSDVRMKDIEGVAFRPAERSHANFMAWHLNKELADKNLRSDLLKGLWRH